MAERYAVASGNWSALATWDGGASLPGAGDDVYANGFLVTIDQDVTVLSLRNMAGTTAAAGGRFIVSTSRTITADLYADPLEVVTTSGASVVVVNGNVTGGSAGNSYAIAHGSTSLQINGNVTGGSGNSAAGVYIISGNITVVGNVTGGSGSAARGIWISHTSTTATITGDVTGGSHATAYGVFHDSTGTVTVTGNVTAATAIGTYNNSTGKMLISGTATASSGASAVSNNSTGIISIGTDAVADASGYFAWGRKSLTDDGASQRVTLMGDAGGGTVGSERTFRTYEKYAVANGNASDAATWDGGSLPTANDYVFANGYTVTIDNSPTWVRAATKAGFYAAAGGGFTLNDGSTLTADVLVGDSHVVTYSGSASAAINGNVNGSETSTSLLYGARNNGTGTLTITGNVTAGSVNNARAVGNMSTGTTRIVGDCLGGGGSNSIASFNNAGGTLEIEGQVTGGSNSGCAGAYNNNVGHIEVTGNVTGGTVAPGVWNNSTGSVAITGNVAGGSGGVSFGVQPQGAGPISIVGNVTAGSVAGANGINSNVAAAISITGNVTGATGINAIRNRSTGSVAVTGDVTGAPATSAAISNEGSGSVTVTGNVIGSGGPGISNTATGPVTVNGNAQAGSGASAISSLGAGIVTIRGNRVASSAGYAAVGGKILCHASDDQTLTYRVETAGAAGAARNLWSEGSYPGV